MSKEYDAYIREHRENVEKGFRWMVEHFRENLEEIGMGEVRWQ